MTLEPPDVLTELLEWHEERIDLQHLARVVERHRDAMNWRAVDRPPVSIKGVDVAGFPRYSFEEEFDDPVKLMIDQLAHPLDELTPGIATSVLLQDDFPLQIQSEYGVGIMPSLFGATCSFAAGGRAWVEPLGGPENVAALLDRGVPDLDRGLLPRVLATLGLFRERLADYPKCSQGIHITQPDLQGCVDILHMLWGPGFFLGLYDHAGLVHELLDLIAETYVAVVRKIQPYTTEAAGDDCIYLHWGVCRGGLLLKNDIPAMISAEMYAEFVRPYDEQVLEAFPGGGSLHIGGGGDHCLEELAKTQHLGCVHLDPQSSTATWYEALRERKIGLVQIVHAQEEILSGQYQQRFPTGISCVTEVGGLEEGQRLMEVIRK